MKLFAGPGAAGCLVRVLVATLSLMTIGRMQAQPVIVSTVPANGATGVPISTSLVITFSEAMNTSVTLCYLVDGVTYMTVPSSVSWSGGNAVLTCRPNAPLPYSQPILWTVMNGLGVSGNPLTGQTGGSFTTAAPASSILLTNATWNPGAFSFDVASPSGQTLTVEYTSTLGSTQWHMLLTTNSPGGMVHITDPQASTNRCLFYRARSS